MKFVKPTKGTTMETVGRSPTGATYSNFFLAAGFQSHFGKFSAVDRKIPKPLNPKPRNPDPKP